MGHTAVSEEEAKSLSGSILTTKVVRLQSEHIGTRKTLVILHGVPMYISEDHLEASMVKYGSIEEVSSVKSQVGISTSDFQVMVTMSHKSFNKVPNVLTCGGQSMYVIVEGHHPFC